MPPPAAQRMRKNNLHAQMKGNPTAGHAIRQNGLDAKSDERSYVLLSYGVHFRMCDEMRAGRIDRIEFWLRLITF